MRKIFTLLAAFLAIAGSAVWGQNTHKVSVRSDSRNIKYEGPTEVKDGETFSFTISGVDGYGEAKFRMTSYSLAMKDEEGNWIDIEHTHSNDWWNLPVTFTVTVPDNASTTSDVEFGGECYAVAYEPVDYTDVRYYFDPADQHIIVDADGIPNSSYTVAEIRPEIEFQGQTYPVKTIVDLSSEYLEKVIIPSSIDTINRIHDPNGNLIIEFESTELPVGGVPQTARVVVPDEETKKKYQRMVDTGWPSSNIFAKGEDLTKKAYERKDSWWGQILMNMQYVGPQKLKEGDVFLLDVSDYIDIKDGEKLLLFDSHKGNFEYEIVDGKKELPVEIKVTKIPAGVETLEFEAEAYVKVQEQAPITYYYNPDRNAINPMIAVATGQTEEEVVELSHDIEYNNSTYPLRRIYDVKGLNAKKLVIPSLVREIDENALGSNWESIEFLGTNPPECGNNNPGLNDNCVIIVQNEEAKANFEASEAFGKYKIEVKGEEEPELPERISFNYDYVENGTIKIAYSDKIPAAYDTIPAGTSSIVLIAEPMFGYKLAGKITVTEPPYEGVAYEDGAVVELSPTTSFIAIEANFVKDDAAKDEVEETIKESPALVTEGTLENVEAPTLIAESSDFNTGEDTGVSIKLVQTEAEESAEVYIGAYTTAEGEIEFEYENVYTVDITPMYITLDGTIKEATVSTTDGVSVAFPYPEGLGADDFEDIAVLHMKKNGEFEYFSEGNNLELKETHIELSGITSFSPFVLIYTKAEVDPEPEIPEFTTYYDLHITQSVGAKLVSRHGKDQVEEGGSFTLSLEKEEGYEDCNPTVYVKRGRSGEWQEVKLDEVSGYYQIRDVYTDIYVKVSGDGIYPVGNESIETSDTKVYSLNGKIVVETAQPKEVYVVTLAGAVVANAQVVGKQTFDNLVTGVYIVRAGETIVKLQVRN